MVGWSCVVGRCRARQRPPCGGGARGGPQRCQSATGPVGAGQSSVGAGLPSPARRAARGRAGPERPASSRCEQVRAAGRGPAQRLVAAPAGDPRVVAGEQHVGHLAAAPGWPAWCSRAPRAGPSACDSSTSDSALPITPGQQPGDRLDDRQHRDLAAVEHVVAEADLGRPRPRRAGLVEHPLVDALVAAAGEDQPRLGGQLVRQRLGERHAARASAPAAAAACRAASAAEHRVEGRRPTARAA